MDKLSRQDLLSLERYAEVRSEFRARVLGHKQYRRLALGRHCTLLFEDRLTMHYQIQEILRVERIFEAADIEQELDAYNPLIPDGGNWKATLLIEYENVEERQQALARLIGIENRVWARFGDGEKIYAVADEDMDRQRGEEKTAAVHFLRFEFPASIIDFAKAGAPLAIGVDHELYLETVDPVAEPIRQALVNDFD